MTKKQVIELAKQAGASRYTNRHYPDRPTHTFTVEQLETFATLVGNAKLEEAKQIAKSTCSSDAALYGDGFNSAALVIECAIESLKEPTP